jgi:arylsulfatase A-like enzyme
MASRCARRNFLASAGAGALGVLAGRLFGAEVESGRKPNVVVIISDDQGYADVGYHGCKDIPTPHIDSLVANGVRFSSGYVSCPVCSPTRAGLITGRYQQRFGHEFNTGPPPGSLEEHVGLPLTEVTLADLMKQAGYVTGAVGKWHLGMRPKYHPLKRGFDEFFGFQHGGHSYLRLKPDSYNPIQRGTEPVHEKEYLTDAFTREAVAFIEHHHDEPFFLYLTYNAVHTPMEATEKYLSRLSSIGNKRRRTYAAMLSAMDDGIGAVLKKVREHGLEQDTMIFFFSDNGGPAANASRNDPLRGTKGTMYEGGIRVPFLLQWPRRVRGGSVYEDPVISLDVLPTVVAAAGGELPKDRPVDGIDLIPYVTGAKQGPPHERLFWRSGNRYAVRHKNWKLVKPRAGATELYDLSKDIGEHSDLAEREPDTVAQLNHALTDWEKQMIAPRWGPPRRGKKRARVQGARKKQKKE